MSLYVKLICMLSISSLINFILWACLLFKYIGSESNTLQQEKWCMYLPIEPVLKYWYGSNKVPMVGKTSKVLHQWEDLPFLAIWHLALMSIQYQELTGKRVWKQRGLFPINTRYWVDNSIKAGFSELHQHPVQCNPHPSEKVHFFLNVFTINLRTHKFVSQDLRCRVLPHY